MSGSFRYTLAVAKNPDIEPERKRAAAVKIVGVLQEAGHTAYFAGGCVRDQIMGRHPSDYDVATDAQPDRVTSLFRGARHVGEAFGVVMARAMGVWIEVATFRTESGYADGRHPDHVEFSDDRHDALRRDFTINGLFYDPATDRVIDHVEGRADIERRIVRAIGDPRDRLAEDYLRMLRAVRFAARLDFQLDPATAEAIRENAPKLRSISRERIGIEVMEMMSDPHRARAARLMQNLHLDAPVLGEPRSERELIGLAALGPEAGAVTALAAWAIDRHLSPHRPEGRVALIDALDRIKAVQTTRNWRKAMVLSNEQRDELGELLRTLPRVLLWSELEVAGKKRLLGRADWGMLRMLVGAVLALSPGAVDVGAMDEEAKRLRAEGVSPEPLVTGDDLIAAGLVPGPMFKTILERVYDAQLGGAITTRDEGIGMARTMARA